MRVYLEAYGCTQNYGEGRLMREALAARGHTITASEGDADAHVLVTCTVVETTERKMIRRMAELASHDKPLVVAGCMAAAQRDRVLAVVPRAKLLAPRKWPQIVELLGAGTVCGDRVANLESSSFGWNDAIVPIAQGCAGRCTYCITRVARGRVASYPVDRIVDQVRASVERGVREIKLTGQDTAAFGMDSGTNLAELLRAIDSIPGEFRLRVGMADPLTVYPIRDDLIDAFASEKVFKFLHLPVQSGSDGILDAMKREYTVAEFEEIVLGFRRTYPQLTLSTDIIVGFPGETDADFEATMDLVRRIRPDIVNVTRFSARPGTPAARMDRQVLGRKVKERSRRLTRLRFEIAREINGGFVGRDVRALMTEVGKEHTTIGRTPEYRQVVIAERFPIGEFVCIHIDEAWPTDLRGRRVLEPLDPSHATRGNGFLRGIDSSGGTEGDKGLYRAAGMHDHSPVV